MVSALESSTYTDQSVATMDIMSVVPSHVPIYFKGGNGYEPLPEWCRFLMDLGAAAVARTRSDRRIVVGVAVPTRGFAAALVSVGVVAARWKQAGDRVTPDAHFARLRALPSGTSVTVVLGKKTFKGLLSGFQRMDIAGSTVDMIGVQTDDKSGGSTTHWITQSQCLKIQVTSQPSTAAADLPHNQRGRQLRTNRGFVQSVLDSDTVYEFERRSHLECLILGNPTAIRHELTDAEFAVQQKNTSFVPGHLQDVLRVRGYPGAEGAYRSEVITVRGGVAPSLLTGETAPVTIFDGAASFLKWRDDWKQSQRIVLLDRTEPSFCDAVETLNGEYVTERIDDDPIALAVVPSGIEVMAFEEAVR